jgi:hypothetical protein
MAMRWWRPPTAPQASLSFNAILEGALNDVGWKSADETKRRLDLMSEVRRARAVKAKTAGRRMVGTGYSSGLRRKTCIRFCCNPR